MRILLLVLCFAWPHSVIAGSADAVISGKTESGRTEFEVLVSDIDGLIRLVRLTIDGKTYLIKDTDIAFQTVIRDQPNGLYVLIVRSEERVFKLWMIPKTEKIVEERDGIYRSRFAAVLEASDPRELDGSLTPRITIGCSLRWEI